jgi:hypothetical protein
VNCIPALTYQLHEGLIAHGEHLTSRCQGWNKDMVRRSSSANTEAMEGIENMRTH